MPINEAHMQVMSKLQDILSPLTGMEEMSAVKKWEDLTEERQYRFLEAIKKIQTTLTQSVIVATHELSDTVEMNTSVLNAVLQSTKSIDQSIAKTQRAIMENLSGMERIAESNEKALTAAKDVMSSNGMAVEQISSKNDKTIRSIFYEIGNVLSQLNGLKTIIDASKITLNTSSEMAEMSKKSMKEFKSIIDNNSKRLSEMVSILKEFTEKMSENSYAIRMNSTVSENIIKKLDELNVGTPVPVATEVPLTWNTIIVDVVQRNYQGNIETVRIRKET